MRVLVVDHNRDDLDRMDQILEDHTGIDYRLCDRPDQALTLLNKGEIDCLLLDIHMPAMDGLQMIQKVRELQGGTWLPTLFMASAEDVKSRGRALRAQGDAMLTKPIEPEILLNQLQVIERLVKAQAELKAAKDRVEQIAREDDLTGILNRRGIEQELHQALALSWRFNTPMSLLLIDVDRFRAFNEAQGVQAGDQALKMIRQALGSAAGAAGNRLYYDAIKLIQDDVATGQQLQFSMRASGLFPNMVVQMVSIGEESGALDEMLHKAANHYEDAVDKSVDNLTSLMEPMIMSFLGVVIDGLVIAMYLPIFQMGSVV